MNEPENETPAASTSIPLDPVGGVFQRRSAAAENAELLLAAQVRTLSLKCAQQAKVIELQQAKIDKLEGKVPPPADDAANVEETKE